MVHWIVNASPIICLARAGLLDLLRQLPEKADVPQAVIDEILAGPPGDPARQAIVENRFPVIETVNLPEILAWDLGKGETAVLSYALSHPGTTAILDDRAARKCAKSFAIPCKGTLAAIILSKQRGLIPSAADALRALQAAGLRLDDAVIRAALQQSSGEGW